MSGIDGAHAAFLERHGRACTRRSSSLLDEPNCDAKQNPQFGSARSGEASNGTLLAIVQRNHAEAQVSVPPIQFVPDPLTGMFSRAERLTRSPGNTKASSRLV